TDAASLVEYCKYPPLGTRSWGPYVALPQSGLTAAEYLRAANYETIVLAMIETRTALDAIDEILAVDGIDGVFVGPSDLSIALSAGQGIGPNSEPVLVALDLVVRMARAAGKYTGVFAETGDWARMAAGVGFDLIAVGNDSSLLMLAAHQELEIARRL
ncbi:MAG: hypothetical protein LBK28_04970, partial [Propionibacteriaceae bacterium]|nr:hypothetical protein [Propionibacteriaceae bacterium]